VSLKNFEVFDNSVQAHLMKSKLESEGISCLLFDENIVTLSPMNSNLMGGIKLKIPEEYIPKAKEIFHKIRHQPVLDKLGRVVTCPNCNSEYIDPNFRSIGNVKGVLAMLLSFIFFVYPIYFKIVNKCNNCGHQFDKT